MNRNRIKWLIKLCLIFGLITTWRQPAGAQEVVTFSITEGLAHSDVRYIFHDPDGWLWIGTWDGLSRYDGHTFNNYRNIPGDSTSLSGDYVKGFARDNRGYLWVNTHSENLYQLARYNPQTDNFSHLKLSINPKRSGKADPILVFDNNGNGWCLQDEGLFWFDPVSFSSRFIDISDFNSLNSKLLAASDGLWIAVSQGLYRFSYSLLMQKAKLTRADAEVSYRFEGLYYDKYFVNILQMQNGVFVIGTNDLKSRKFNLFVTSSDKSFLLKELPLPHFHQTQKSIVSLFIHQIAPNQILLSTGYPAFAVFDTERMAYDYNHPLNEFFTQRIHKIAISGHQQTLWIGGQEGMYRYSEPQLNFRSWVYDPADKNGLGGRRITSLHKDKQNRLWVGSVDGGLIRINLNDNSISSINPPAEQDAESSNRVLDIIPLNDDEALINYGSSLFRYHLAENRFSFIRPVDYIVYTHYFDSQNRLWISERGKISVFNKDDLSPVQEFNGVDFCRFPTTCRQIYEDRNKQFWFCCGVGLVKCNFDAPMESQVFVAPGSESQPEVICMHERADGSLWLGTLKNGVYVFDPVTEKFTSRFSTENGLIDNSVNKIYEDRNGYLWMNTWKGIARLNTADSSITNYSTVNGLPFPEFNTNAHIIDEDGTIYFGGEGGVVTFHPDSLVNFEIKARPGITAIKGGFGLLPLNYPLRDGAVITLPYDRNSFSVSFSAFDFRHPEQRMYRYRLAGWNDDWQMNSGNDMTAHFAGLKPGNYVFELQTTYKGWPWVMEQCNIQVVILKPPFFLSGTFRIVVAVSAVLLLVAVVLLLFRNYKIRKEVQISRLEREANQSKLNFLKSQMNPHSYFNTLNAINSFILDNDIRSANKYLTTFARMMRRILENSQKDFISVSEESDMLQEYLRLQQLRFPDLFDYEVFTESSLKEMLIPPMILQPFVENSVEYAFTDVGYKGLIEIKFEKTNEGFRCEVSDNGIGMKKSQQLKTRSNRKSTALQNIARRIEILQKIYFVNIKLEYNDSYPDEGAFPGTTVTLYLPDFRKSISYKQDKKL